MMTLIGNVRPDLTLVLDTVGQPFSQPAFTAIAAASVASQRVITVLPLVIAAIWFVGFAAILLTWWTRWRRVAAVVRTASPVDNGRELTMLRRLAPIVGTPKPIGLVSTDTALEPGVFGIASPVLLWPRSVAERLDDGQVEAVLKHELSHVVRRDNLTAALHMLVEAFFWFHPLVWWIGARLVDERERACDEDVVRLGSEPQVYAQSILRICESYVEAPLPCVAGVTGSDLEKRIERIMKNHAGTRLNAWSRLFLATAGIVAVAGPIVLGAMNAPRLRAQSPAASAGVHTFEVASVKPNKSRDEQPSVSLAGGRFTATNARLRDLVRLAYQLQDGRLRHDSQISGGPSWINSDRFDIDAKASGIPAGLDANDIPAGAAHPAEIAAIDEVRLMLRQLLADRFKLTVHNETRELPVYALVMAGSAGSLGPRLRKVDVDCAALRDAGRRPARLEPEKTACGGFRTLGRGRTTGHAVPMAMIAKDFEGSVGRIVLDRTGLSGTFDLDLAWTPDGPSIFTAVQEQLGLKLVSQNGPVDVLVIDRAEKPR